ncbi:MAG: filamentous hemagglutinin N-terminal domain-containing protein, partial [Burkholderiaceae bacterium]
MSNHPPFPLARCPNPIWWALLLQLGLLASTSAQIRTDSSLGHAAQTLAGPAYTIPQSIGKIAGNNLFHSFEAFNIGSGQSANFTTSSPGLANVISRVTGGTLSQINGQLKLTPVSGAPNFFFINPAGVTFGAGASVDVPAAFHVSTANSVKFADGNFSADLGQTSTFSSAAPQAFGFLGTTRAPITVAEGATLSLPGSQSISLVAGDVELNNGRIASAAGDIRVAALGQKAQDVAFSGTLAAGSGNLSIKNGGAVSASASSSDSAGSVKV